MKKNIKGHLIGVAIFSVVAIGLDYINFRSNFSLLREFLFLGIEVWIFYSFVAVLERASRRKLSALSVFVLSVGIMVALNHLRGLLAARYGQQTFDDRTDFIINTATIYIRVSLYSLGYFFFRKMLEKQAHMAEARQKTSEAEKNRLEAENRVLQLQEERSTLQAQLLEAEINFLKAQINPHFLFNCLNFFYSEVLTAQPKVAEGIIALSQVMRYSMQDFSRKGGMASLEEELEHIGNVIRIHQLRYMEGLHINYQVTGDPQGVQIAPMMLITLVENIFKHGDLTDPEQPAQVHFRIDEAQQRVCLDTFNKKKTRNLSPATGSRIGIRNIEMRLDRLYPGRYCLDSQDDGHSFRLRLCFPFATSGAAHATHPFSTQTTNSL